MADLPSGTVFEGRWRLGRKIGEGACAKVYEVTPVNPAHADFPLVAKVIQLPRAGSKSAKDKEQRRLCDTLYHEYNVCVNNFHDLECIPRRPLRFYGESDGYRYLVMEKLESDLSDVAKRGETTAPQAGRLGLQILDGLKHIHQKGFFFIDIKPDNFMLKGDRLFFVDFGLAEKRPNPTAGLYGGPDAGRTFAGTATYASIDALSGKMPAAADEIIAMVYVLLAVLNGGKLPWTGAQSDADIIRMKQAVDMHEFAGDLQAEELFTILDEVQREGVNYDRIASHLQRMANKNVGKASAAAKGRATSQKTTSSEATRNSSPLKGARPSSSRSQKAPPAAEEEPVVLNPKTSKRKAAAELPSVKEVEPVVERPRSKGRITSAAAKAAAIAAKSVPVVDISVDEPAEDAPVAKKRGRTVVRNDVVDLSAPFSADDDQSEDLPSTRKRSRAVTAASRKQTAPAPVPAPVPVPVPAPAPKGAQSKVPNAREERPISPVKTAPSSKATASRASSSRGKSRSPVTAAPDIEVDPDDILGYEDGIPSYLNACYEEPAKPAKSSASTAAASGPFSLRKSEYHRHRLSSFGGTESIGSPSPVKTTRKGRK